jgi:hypothetical protein
MELSPGGVLTFKSGEEPRILSVVEGTLVDADGGEIYRGDNILLPYSGQSSWQARDQAASVLVTDRFNCVK